LGDDPALVRLEEEAQAGEVEPSARTRQRVVLALEDAAERDVVFEELAAAASEELLTDQLRVLGPDHPHTLTTRNNLAYWRAGVFGNGRS
jgi:hypothetical protein